MAISWGAYEGNIRVGIEVDWEAISHSETAATATVRIYTDTSASFSDTQTLTFGGSISGSVTFSNNQSSGGGAVLRATKTYTYDYPASSYGSSPGSRTFSANLSGAYNGATPSKSVSSSIPARPYGVPLAPTNVNVSRVSPSSSRITWTNRDTTGEPWNTVRIQYDGAANDVWNGDIGTTGGTGTSFTASVGANSIYKWRVRAENSVGDSAWVETGIYYGDPNPPGTPTRSNGTGSQQVVTWADGANAAMPYTTEVWVSRDGGTIWTLLSTVAKGTTSYTDTAAVASQQTGYRLRHKVTSGEQGTVYSVYTADSSFTAGVTYPPSAPIGLDPTDSNLISPKTPTDLSWVHQTNDQSGQQAYQIQWRYAGGAWPATPQFSGTTAQKHTVAANGFNDNQTVEWQVRTKGADPAYSPWSATATFKTVGDPNTLREQKRVLRMDMATGDYETSKVGVLPPIGSMMLWPAESPPQGWLIAEGGTFDGNAYPGLLGVLGSTTLPYKAPEWIPDAAPVTSGLVTAISGWVLNSHTFQMLSGNIVQFGLGIAKNGTALSLGNPDHTNQNVLNWTAAAEKYKPSRTQMFPTNDGFRHIGVTNSIPFVATSGINDNSYANSNFDANETASIDGSYPVPPPAAAPRFRWIIKAE